MIGIIAIGVAVGCVYALVAAGYSVTYRTTGVVNFAQGSYVMAAGMTTSWAISEHNVPYPIAVLIGLVVAVVIGCLVWTIATLPLWRLNAPSYVVLLATIVCSALVSNVFQLWLGSSPRSLDEWTGSSAVTIDGTRVSGQYLLVIGVAIVLLALLGVLISRTALGRRMRAVAASRETSRLIGISPDRIGLQSLALGALLGGLAGVLIAPAQFVSVDSALTYGVFGFVAAVLGGFGSLRGALIGGLVLGVIQTLVGRYLSADFETVIAFGAMLALLTVRPSGLIGAGWSES